MFTPSYKKKSRVTKYYNNAIDLVLILFNIISINKCCLPPRTDVIFLLKWIFLKMIVIETRTFYFEGTSEVMCCYFAQRDGRVVGDTGTGTAVIHKHTQGSPALLPLAA